MRVVVKGCVEADLVFNSQLKLTNYIKHLNMYKNQCVDNHVRRGRLGESYYDAYEKAVNLYPLDINITP